MVLGQRSIMNKKKVDELRNEKEKETIMETFRFVQSFL